MSWASSLAVVLLLELRADFDDIAVMGFSSRIASILRTTSGHAIVCMSACAKLSIGAGDRNATLAYIWNLE